MLDDDVEDLKKCPECY